MLYVIPVVHNKYLRKIEIIVKKKNGRCSRHNIIFTHTLLQLRRGIVGMCANLSRSQYAEFPIYQQHFKLFCQKCVYHIEVFKISSSSGFNMSILPSCINKSKFNDWQRVRREGVTRVYYVCRGFVSKTLVVTHPGTSDIDQCLTSVYTFVTEAKHRFTPGHSYDINII